MFINDYNLKNLSFVDLALGEVFYSKEDSDYFMVTQNIELENENEDIVMYNAVCLTTGYMIYFKDEDKVERVRGEFKVK